MPKKLLIITSSGGGGLLQTANAKEQEARAKDPHVIIIRKDVLKDWVPFSRFFIGFWNQAQQRGRIWAQVICVKGQFLVDFVLFPSIFFCALYTALKEDVDAVIDTQPMGTAAIIKALRIFNRKRRKNTRVEKVLVDLPTRGATHFFRPIKKLSRKSRRLLQLVTIQPLLEKGETAEQFWQETCGLSEKEVRYEDPYVRQGFLKYKGKKRTRSSVTLKVAYKNGEELSLMRRSFERGPIRASVKEGGVEFQVEPEDRIITILLGSQPAKGATYSYVKKKMAMAHEFPEAKIHLFVFCANHKEGEETLFKKVAAFAAEIVDYPKNVSVIPFSFQSEEVIASLFHRSDATCTRSGGQTAMELMSVSTGAIWIHSEAKEGQDLLSGIPGWEADSAIYLQRIRGAKIVTPENVAPEVAKVYQTDSRQASATLSLQSTA